MIALRLAQFFCGGTLSFAEISHQIIFEPHKLPAQNEITECLERGEPVRFSSFGSFIVRKRRQHIGRNPKTGKQVSASKPKPRLIWSRTILLISSAPGARHAIRSCARSPRHALTIGCCIARFAQSRSPCGWRRYPEVLPHKPTRREILSGSASSGTCVRVISPV